MRAQTLIVTSVLASGLTIGAVAPVAAQGAANWGGFYVDGALGFRNSTTQVTQSQLRTTTDLLIPSITQSNNNSKANLGSTNFLGQISAGWRWAPGPVVVGLGINVDLAGNSAASYKSPWSQRVVVGGINTYTTGYNNIEVKQKDRYGISLDVGPNWRTHPYAKVSFNWASYDVKYEDGACGMVAGVNGSSGGSFSNNFTGFGLGGGVRHLQTDNLYFFAEVMYTGFGSNTKRVQPTCSAALPATTTINSQESYKASPNNVSGVIGVGWKF